MRVFFALHFEFLWEDFHSVDDNKSVVTLAPPTHWLRPAPATPLAVLTFIIKAFVCARFQLDETQQQNPKLNQNRNQTQSQLTCAKSHRGGRADNG